MESAKTRYALSQNNPSPGSNLLTGIFIFSDIQFAVSMFVTINRDGEMDSKRIRLICQEKNKRICLITAWVKKSKL